MNPGDAYWITDLVDGEEIKHLHIVLTHPEPNSTGEFVVAVANVSTVRSERHDKTVVLKKSDYSGFTEQRYYVAYLYAGFEKVDDIESKRGYAAAASPFAPKVFQRIFDGALRLDGMTPPAIREYCSARVSSTPGRVRNLWQEQQGES